MRSNIVASFFDKVTNDVNNYLSLLVASGAIADGQCIVDPGRNNEAARAAGTAYFVLDYQPAFPVTRIYMNVNVVTGAF